MNQQQWMDNGAWLPIEGEIVMTKIDDAKGSRNVQSLKRMGNLWYTPDGSMYVYYTPTHWRSCTEIEKEEAMKQVRAAHDRIPAVTSLTFG